MVKALLLLHCAMLAIASEISLKPLPVSGVELHHATDPSIKSFVADALGPAADLEYVRDLLPYSAVIDNNSGQKIIAYTLRLTFSNPEGKISHDTRQYFQL